MRARRGLVLAGDRKTSGAAHRMQRKTRGLSSLDGQSMNWEMNKQSLFQVAIFVGLRLFVVELLGRLVEELPAPAELLHDLVAEEPRALDRLAVVAAEEEVLVVLLLPPQRPAAPDGDRLVPLEQLALDARDAEVERLLVRVRARPALLRLLPRLLRRDPLLLLQAPRLPPQEDLARDRQALLEQLVLPLLVGELGLAFFFFLF